MNSQEIMQLRNQIVNTDNTSNQNQSSKQLPQIPISPPPNGGNNKNIPPNANAGGGPNNGNPYVASSIDKVFELLKYGLITHFYTTVFVIICCAILFICSKYNISLLDIIGLSKSDIIINAGAGVHTWIYVSLFMIIGILMFMHYKISKIDKYTQINQYFSDATVKELDEVHAVLTNLTDQFSDSVANIYPNVSDTINTLNIMMSENTINIKRVIDVLVSVNNAIKRIPNKGTILDMLSIRTKLLSISIIELVGDYFASVVSSKTLKLSNSKKSVNEDQLTIDRSTKAFIKDRFVSRLHGVKDDYIEDIYTLSNNTLSPSIKNEIIERLTIEFQEIINNITPESEITIASVSQYIIYIIDVGKRLSVEFNELYSNNLILTPFFNNNIVVGKGDGY